MFALDALADHEEDWEEVGEEKTGDGEGDDGVEGGGGANVDQSNKGGNSSAKDDGTKGKGRFADLKSIG